MWDAADAGRTGNLRQLAIAGTLGLFSGVIFFSLVHPALLGWRPRPVLEYSAFWEFVTFEYPAIFVPFVCSWAALFRPRSRAQAFTMALVLSATFLIPIPLLDYWQVWPSLVGEPTFSRDILFDVLAGLLYLAMLALFASVLAAFVSPALYRMASSRGRKLR